MMQSASLSHYFRKREGEQGFSLQQDFCLKFRRYCGERIVGLCCFDNNFGYVTTPTRRFNGIAENKNF